MSEAELWQAQSRRDLAAAQALLPAGLHGHAAFHLQQAAEKALKALVIAKQNRLPRTHDLVILAQQAQVTLHPAEMDQLEELNVLYTSTRYPGDWGLLPDGQPSPAQLAHYASLAEKLLQVPV
jgi:HEPN domain-containing protein